jgi:hypothetical protein
MSSALVLDNRINVSSESTTVVPISGQQINYFLVPADGSSFPNQIQFNNIVTPSLTSTVVSRNIRILYRMQVAYPTNAALPLSLPKPSYDPSYQINGFLRQFPLQTCCDSISLVLNGSTTTYNSRQTLSALARRIPKEYLKKQASEMPSASDNRAILVPGGKSFTGSWSAGVYPGAGNVNVVFSNGMTGTFVSTGVYPAVNTATVVAINEYPGAYAYWVAGSAFVANAVNHVYVDLTQVSGQPTNKYEACEDGASRASFKPLTFQQNVAVAGLVGNQDVWTFEISEPIMVSPLTLHDKETFLALINTLSLQLNFSSLTDAVVASGLVSAASYDQSLLNVQITGVTPQLQLTYIQVDPEIVKIPTSVDYSYEQVVYYPKTAAYTMALTTDAQAPIQMVSDTLRFQTMPKLIAVFARQAMSSRLAPAAAQLNCRGRVSDCYLPIGDSLSGNGNVSIQIGTRTGLLASASRKQLYRMSVENGYTGSWEDFSFGSGSILFIDPVKDLGINVASDSLPGFAANNVNFQISAMFNSDNYKYVAQTEAQRAALGVPQGQCPIELMVVAIYSGKATLDAQGCIFSLGDITPQQISTLVNTAPKDGSMVSSEAVQPTIEGRGLFTQKSIMGKMASGAKRMAQTVMPGRRH